MDIISFNEASTANGRIEKVIANPDSTSGIVTVPSTIAVGETITIPTGRTAVLPNMVVDGTLVVNGEVFVPSGATFGDLETQIATKANLVGGNAFTGVQTSNGGRVLDDDTTAYNVDTTSFIANTLASGAIIERGSNANGSYVKFADGTLICNGVSATVTTSVVTGNIFNIAPTVTFPHAFIDVNYTLTSAGYGSSGVIWTGRVASETTTTAIIGVQGSTNTSSGYAEYTVIGKWK